MASEKRHAYSLDAASATAEGGLSMKKRIACPECNGNGRITLARMYNDYCGIGCKQCDHCGGKGFLEVPMTNSDSIKATDNELATMLHAVKMGYAPWCDYHCENEGDDGCDNCIKKWLQQPAEEG